MKKAEAIYQFWSSFGLEAYEENSLPTGENKPNLPYISFSVAQGSFGDEIPLSASLWYRSQSRKEIELKTEEISKAIGRGGLFMDIEGGKLWIKRGQPFAQAMGDETDSLIKRQYINITVEFLTED